MHVERIRNLEQFFLQVSFEPGPSHVPAQKSKDKSKVTFQISSRALEAFWGTRNLSSKEVTRDRQSTSKCMRRKTKHRRVWHLMDNLGISKHRCDLADLLKFKHWKKWEGDFFTKIATAVEIASSRSAVRSVYPGIARGSRGEGKSRRFAGGERGKQQAKGEEGSRKFCQGQMPEKW